MSYIGSLSASQAADKLGMSVDSIKRLCGSGKLPCFRTAGNHIRIPDEAIEEFRQGKRNSAASSAGTTLSPLKSRREAVEELALEAQEIRARRQVDELREEDLRERAARETAAKAEASRQEFDRDERRREQQRQARQAEEGERRRSLQASLVATTMKAAEKLRMSLEERAAVYEAVQQAVLEFDLSQSPEVLAGLIAVVVNKATQPFQRKQGIAKVIDGARCQLPASAKGFGSLSEWEERAIAEAAKAIRAMAPDASLEEMRAAATQAGKRICVEYDRWQAGKQHRLLCDQVVAFVGLDGEAALAAAKAAIGKVPVGTSRLEMERARDSAVAPFRAARKAAADAERFLPRVRSYIEELGNEKDGEWDLGGPGDRRRLSEELQGKIRPQLAQHLLKLRCEDYQIGTEAAKFIKERVDRELEL